MPAVGHSDLYMEGIRLDMEKDRAFHKGRGSLKGGRRENLEEWSKKYSSDQYYRDGMRRDVLLAAEHLERQGNWQKGGEPTEASNWYRNAYQSLKDGGFGATSAIRQAENALGILKQQPRQAPSQTSTLAPAPNAAASRPSPAAPTSPASPSAPSSPMSGKPNYKRKRKTPGSNYSSDLSKPLDALRTL